MRQKDWADKQAETLLDLAYSDDGSEGYQYRLLQRFAVTLRRTAIIACSVPGRIQGIGDIYSYEPEELEHFMRDLP